MATFILIHGAWHWGGCFGKVANILGANGHAVIAPDMAGHGFDATPLGHANTLDLYAASTRAALEQVEGRAVLVGHSVGGATCTWLGETLPEKIAALVYLTGFMAPARFSARDYVMTPTYLKDPAIVESQGLLRMGRDGLAIDLARRDLLTRSLYSDCSEHDIAMALRNLTGVNAHTPFTAVSMITPARYGQLPRHYIECLRDRALPLGLQRLMQADVPGAAVHALDAGHSPFFSAPEALADILMDIA
ncbi:alpha/beta fold hydrolase [Ancylobacter terrae]|uniref:alpha/beta fold hydrolase n=1 Tax=Ancylobacter sp. sgz301288 TaxID=3342077 RepID=UPI00385F33A0